MLIKINRYTFNVTNKDWVLDNGSCYQCMTLRHNTTWRNNLCKPEVTIMSKSQLKQLVKENKLVDITIL